MEININPVTVANYMLLSFVLGLIAGWLLYHLTQLKKKEVKNESNIDPQV